MLSELLVVLQLPELSARERREKFSRSLRVVRFSRQLTLSRRVLLLPFINRSR